MAPLASLGLGALTLTPSFSPDVTEYTTSTTNASNIITATGAGGAPVAITVNGTTHANRASATWAAGTNVVKITVGSGAVQQTYTVTVTKSEA